MTAARARFVKGTLDWYGAAWEEMTFDPGYEKVIKSTSLLILSHRARYEDVSTKTGIPWDFIAGVHWMEASCDFRGALHNGDRIIGTNRKTYNVPKDRGPFSTWEGSAIDALALDGLTSIKKWPIEVKLQQAERYNGGGYLKYHRTENTPYLWAQSSINDGDGLYTSDGSWSESAATNARPGIATIFKQWEIDKILEFVRVTPQFE